MRANKEGDLAGEMIPNDCSMDSISPF